MSYSEHDAYLSSRIVISPGGTRHYLVPESVDLTECGIDISEVDVDMVAWEMGEHGPESVKRTDWCMKCFPSRFHVVASTRIRRS
jgi:hypothetical protein